VDSDGDNIFYMMTQDGTVEEITTAFAQRINEDVEVESLWDLASSSIRADLPSTFYTSDLIKLLQDSGKLSDVEYMQTYLDNALKELGETGGIAEYIEAAQVESYEKGLAFAESGNYVDALTAFMEAGGYADAVEKVEKYRTVGAIAGDIITFGSYDLDGNSDNGKEEMEWIVLTREDNKLYLISKYLLDKQQYASNMVKDGNFFKSVTSWKQSTLRQWLNGTFYNDAFSAEEMNYIQSTTVKETFWSDKQDPEITSESKILLLSQSDVSEYLSDRTAYTYKGEEGLWWLREVHTLYPYNAYYVDWDGGYKEYRDVDQTSFVRPAMWIDVNDMPVE
jgi:hypothetical protein